MCRSIVKFREEFQEFYIQETLHPGTANVPHRKSKEKQRAPYNPLKVSLKDFSVLKPKFKATPVQ